MLNFRVNLIILKLLLVDINFTINIYSAQIKQSLKFTINGGLIFNYSAQVILAMF